MKEIAETSTSVPSGSEMGKVLICCPPGGVWHETCQVCGGPVPAVMGLAVTAVMSALIGAAPVLLYASAHNVPPPLAIHPVYGPLAGAGVLTAWALLYWYCLASNRRSLLVLHERGLLLRVDRAKLLFLPLAFVRKITFGQTQESDRLLNKLKYIAPNAGQQQRLLRVRSVTVHFADGSKRFLRNLMLGFKPDDVIPLWREIQERWPTIEFEG